MLKVKRAKTSETHGNNFMRANKSTFKDFEQGHMQTVDDGLLMAGSSTTTDVQHDIKKESDSEMHLVGASSSSTVTLQGQLSIPALHFPAPIPPPHQPLVSRAQQTTEATDDLLDALNVDNAPVLTLIADLVPNSLLPHAIIRNKFHRCYAQPLAHLYVSHLNSSPMHMVVLEFLLSGKIRPRARSL